MCCKKGWDSEILRISYRFAHFLPAESLYPPVSTNYYNHSYSQIQTDSGDHVFLRSVTPLWWEDIIQAPLIKRETTTLDCPFRGYLPYCGNTIQCLPPRHCPTVAGLGYSNRMSQRWVRLGQKIIIISMWCCRHSIPKIFLTTFRALTNVKTEEAMPLT